VSEWTIREEPRQPAVADRQREVYAEGWAFTEVAVRWFPVLKRAARWLSRGDVQLANEMVQEALIDLWERDVTRFDASEEKVLKKILSDRMKFVRDRERIDWGAGYRVAGDPEAAEEDDDGTEVASEAMLAVFEGGEDRGSAV
jgi:DNA-directed RNA polymerase specialized sigma24 family protein